MAKDYYNILGVDKKASSGDIKKAFRKLAQKYHPDKTSGDESRFKEVNEAYQVLSNDKARAEYDAYGQTFGGAGGAGGFGFSGFQKGAAGMDFGDIFSEFFGGGRRGGARTKRGSDISIDVQLTFAESIFGVDRKVMLTKHVTCEACHGDGAEPGTNTITCETCGGSGAIHESRQTILGNISTQRECSDCHGKGKKPETKCKACKGESVVRKTEEINIGIPAGIRDGEMIRMTALGEAISGGTPGDLYVKIHVEKHKVFERQGMDLTMDLPVKLSDALLGTDISVETLDGSISINIPSGISHGEILRVKDRGVVMDNAGNRGNLLVRIVVKIPNKLSRKAKKLVEELKEEGI